MDLLQRFGLRIGLCLTVLIIAGCTHDAPVEVSGVTRAEKVQGAPKLVSGLLPMLGDLTLVPMPVASSPKNVENAAMVVTPENGGRLTARLSYTGLLGRPVSVAAVLTVPPGAVSRSVTVSLAVDQNIAGVVFQPEGLEFSKTVVLDYNASGLSLTSTLVAGLGFYYLNYGGPCESIVNNGISITLLTGGLRVDHAQLHHFSQYAFGRVN